MRVYTVKYQESGHDYVVVAENAKSALDKAIAYKPKYTVISIKLEFHGYPVIV